MTDSGNYYYLEAISNYLQVITGNLELHPSINQGILDRIIQLQIPDV